VLPTAARTLGAQGGKHRAHEVHSIYWQCISLLYFRSLPQGYYRTYGPYLIELIMNQNTGDFLSLERAEILCSMSSFLLKGFLSEQSRFVSSTPGCAFHMQNILNVAFHDPCYNFHDFITICRDGCCSFCSVQMSDVVSWLLKAFVLSGESPSLLQEVFDPSVMCSCNFKCLVRISILPFCELLLKTPLLQVCRLLTCIFLLSAIDSTVRLPLYFKGSLSLNHWAAYFHQNSVGTYLNFHYLASLQALPRKTETKVCTILSSHPD
jgi:separase